MSMNKPYYIIYEDNHYLIVNKAPSILVQGDRTGDITLADLAREYVRVTYQKPGNVYLGVPHRLDRPVSGLVVLAKTSKGLDRINELFRKRKIEKTYWAITKRKPPKDQDKLTHWLLKDRDKNTVRAFDQEKEEAQKAQLHYRVLGELAHHYLLEVQPITGRPHQIRVQLASMGCPIRGDIKYGYPLPNEDKSIHLHARRLHFQHPIKDFPLTCIAPVPETAFWEQFLVLDPTPNIKDEEKLGRIFTGG